MDLLSMHDIDVVLSPMYVDHVAVSCVGQRPMRLYPGVCQERQTVEEINLLVPADTVRNFRAQPRDIDMTGLPTV